MERKKASDFPQELMCLLSVASLLEGHAVY